MCLYTTLKILKTKKKKKKKENFFFFYFLFLLPDLYIFFFSLFKIYFDKEKFTYEKKYIHRLYIIDGLKKNCKEEKKNVMNYLYLSMNLSQNTFIKLFVLEDSTFNCLLFSC